MADWEKRLDAEGVRVETGAEIRGKASFVEYRLPPGSFVTDLDGDRLYSIGLTAPTPEQAEVLREFGRMLASVSKDGGKKRAAGLKPSWKVDTSHEAAIFSHLNKWKHGERRDPESGQHPLVHMAWRALAIAWQEDLIPTSEMRQGER